MLPGGLLEAGESSGDAAVRETFEEAGISARGPYTCRSTKAPAVEGA